MKEIIQDAKTRMKKSTENLSRELAQINAGRANSNLLAVFKSITMVRLRLYNNLQVLTFPKHVYSLYLHMTKRLWLTLKKQSSQQI